MTVSDAYHPASGRLFRRYSRFARVWDRHPEELAIVVFDPIAVGVLHPRSGQVIPADEAARASNATPAPGTSPTAPASSSPASPTSPTSPGASYPSDTPQSAAQLAPRVLVLRPAVGTDHLHIDRVRLSDRAWLAPWEPSSPPQAESEPPTLRQFARMMDRMARRSEALIMVAEIDGKIAGVVNASNVVRGAMYGCSMGYWVASWATGQGLGAWAVAATLDLLIGELGMHRVEVNVRPENKPSLALVRKLGLSEEGYKPRFLHINGKWADHIQFATDAESFPEFGFVAHLLQQSDDF